MKTILLCGAALALAGVAQAQPVNPSPAPAAPAATPPASSASPTAPAAGVNASALAGGFHAGMTVKDSQGATIGSIARVIKTPDGSTTYAVTVDGRTVNLPGSALSLSPMGGAVSSMSKAQITASAPPPT